MGKDKTIVGKPLMKAIPELEEQGFEQLLLGVLKTGIAHYAHEMPITLVRHGKKEKTYYNFVCQAQRDVDGKIEGVAVIATEVTAEAELHKKLELSEARFQQITDLVPDMITNATPDGKVFYFNKVWTDFSGWSQKKLKKEGWGKLMHPEELPSVKRNWQRALKTGDDFEMELRILDKNGDFKWHISRAIPVKDVTGKIIMWVGANTEIHRIKEEEKRKENFLKMASHELKTPVTSIKGYTQLLLSMLKSRPPDTIDTIPLVPSLERIDGQISRLTRLISEMLDLSRVEESKLELQREIFNINDLVENSVKDIKYTSDDYKITITHDDTFSVNGDKDRINQVLINFITNAIKYSPKDKNIEIRIYKDEGKGAVSVKDKGIGIDKNDHEHVFKRFYRVSGKDETTYSGFGIGLFLAKEIIERHQGQVAVNSKKGEGSEFIFIIPIVPGINQEKRNEKNTRNGG